MKEFKPYQTQYVEILNRLINNPDKNIQSRIGKVRSRFVEIIRVNLLEEFPLMDIKNIKFSNILHELLWFIKGDTSVNYLYKNNCNIWNDDAFRYYNEKYVLLGAPKLTKEEFLIRVEDKVKFYYSSKDEEHCVDDYCYGDLDRVYGKQWRSFNGKTDQLQNCITTLMKNPDDRRMIVTAHNPSDIEDNIVGLPSCHNMFQFYTIPLNIFERTKIANTTYPDIITKWDEKRLDLHEIPKHYISIWFNIRSNDFFLGQPYNMASYALLLNIIANIVNMIPNEIVCTAIDCHLYEEHIPAAVEYINRYNNLHAENLLCKSKLNIKRKLNSIDDIVVDDFELLNYSPQPFIKAPLLT
jgi:thymidylate synthase